MANRSFKTNIMVLTHLVPTTVFLTHLFQTHKTFGFMTSYVDWSDFNCLFFKFEYLALFVPIVKTCVCVWPNVRENICVVWLSMATPMSILITHKNSSSPIPWSASTCLPRDPRGSLGPPGVSGEGVLLHTRWGFSLVSSLQRPFSGS